MTLYVPEGKISIYSNIVPWKNFGTITEYTDQNDAHQYNAYHVSYTDQETSGSRMLTAGTATADTLGYTPSGIELTLPERITKKLYIYLANWQDKPAKMPADDVVVKVILELMGDLDGSDDLDISDILEMVTAIVDSDELTEEQQAQIERIGDLDGDGIVSIDDLLLVVDIIVNSNED